MAYVVPQGSIQGPIFFLLYVNFINEPIQNVRIVQYANNAALCIKSNTKTDFEINSYIALNSCIQIFRIFSDLIFRILI